MVACLGIGVIVEDHREQARSHNEGVLELDALSGCLVFSVIVGVHRDGSTPRHARSYRGALCLG